MDGGMISIFRKKTVLSKRLNTIEKELSDISINIHTLERRLKRADSGNDAQEEQKAVPQPAEREEEIAGIPEPLANRRNGSHIAAQEEAVRKPVQPGRETEPKAAGKKESIMRDERFVSYLMSRGFQTAGSLKIEKNVQRNKAVIICIIAVIVLWWLLYKFL